MSPEREEKIKEALQKFMKLNNKFKEMKKKGGYEAATAKYETALATSALHFVRVLGTQGLRQHGFLT